MKLQEGIQKMSRYIAKNYCSGSILERANYRKIEGKPYNVYGEPLIERNVSGRNEKTLWRKIKRIIWK